MIDHLDSLLRHLFTSQIAEFASVQQDRVRFRPPDDDWRSMVIGSEGSALNVYLFDLRENRKLRSNERVRSIDNGIVIEEPSPARVDCHYLITAWSPVESSQVAWDEMQDQHALLYDAMAVLMNHAPLNPSRIYPPGSTELDPASPDCLPELIREADLPTQILPVEGFPKYAEFWGTMGTGQRWKPAIYLVVTLPVAFGIQEMGPQVLTRISAYEQGDRPGTTETLVQIGGYVFDATGETISNAWVQLENASGEALKTTRSDHLGRFTFSGLQPGRYQLSWRATGFPVPPSHEVDVPSFSGEYDLRFT